MRTTIVSLLLGVLLLPGCQIVFNEDDDDCQRGDLAYPQVTELRNPQNGVCEDWGGGGGGCGGTSDAVGAPQALPDWAQCNGGCETLDAGTCLQTDGCRLAMDTAGNPLGCWGTAPSGPVHGACAGLDAQECSRHDDCTALYDLTPDFGLGFAACVDEQPCDQPAGDVLLFDPYTGQCTDFGGGGCGPRPLEDSGLAPPPDYAFCETCEGLDEQTCMLSDGCRAIYTNTASGGDAQNLVYTGCHGTAPQGGPIRGGDCTTIADAYECSRHDDCVAIYQGDVSWFESCGPELWATPAPACAEVTDEATCIDLADGCLENGQCNEACSPLYAGSDCSCDAGGCSCATWTYASCTTSGQAGQGFLCGNDMCTSDQYCSAFSGGIMSETTYSCVDMPATCAPQNDLFPPDFSDCGCLGYPWGQDQGGCGCRNDADGNAYVSCNAP